ncbi:MAG TPA: hypothetical protein DFR83_23845, partial [Deltaproteobacteria bacterium]|nr:hypothetical protein [Deltaproteobacteria bacterium]
DWMTTGTFNAHFLGGRLSANAAARFRMASSPAAQLPAGLQSASTFEQAQFEDLRMSTQWALNPGRRLAFSPVASLRVDRKTHIIADDNATPALDLSPLYGLGNTIGVALPVGYSVQAIPVHLTFDPEAARRLSSSDTHADAAELGLNPFQYWARARAAAAWTPINRLSILAEAEARVREDAIRDQAVLGAELRAGLRTAPTDGRWQITALVGHSPLKALGSPAFRGGLALRWTGLDTATDDGGPTLPPGRTLRITIRDPEGSPLPATVSIDGKPAVTVDEGNGTLLLSVPDDKPHDLTVQSPGRATLNQVIQAPDAPDWNLERVLPPSGGDGVFAVRVLDANHRGVPDVRVKYSRPDAAEPPIDLGGVCGDCGLTYSGLPEGTYDLALQAPGLAPGTAQATVSPEPPKAPDDILFLAPIPGRVGIRVVDKKGRPIADTNVQIVGSEPTMVPLDSDGEATVKLAPGRWAIEAEAPGFGRHQVPIEIDPLRPESPFVSMVLLPEDDDDARLTVEVKDAEGIQVGGATVFVGDVPFCTTNNSGSCSRDGLAAGSVSIRVEHPDFLPDASGTILLEPGKGQKKVFALGWQPGAILIQVRDQDGRAADAKVLLEGPDGIVEFRTGPAGRQKKKLDAGTWTAIVRESGYRAVSIPFEVKPNGNTQVPVALSLLPEVDSSNEDAATLRIFVVDETDQPVQGASVKLDVGQPGTTSNNGILSVPIPAGLAQIAVRQEYFDPFEVEVEVEGGAVQDVEAKLKSRLGKVQILAVDPDDKGIEAQVQLTGPGGDTRQRRLARDGTGTYRLASGYWEIAFASQSNGFGVRDVDIVRETADYEVKWIGIRSAEPAVLTAPDRRPTSVELWSRPADAPTPGTVRLLGPEVLPPYTVGDSGTWTGELRPGLWEVVATAPSLGIGGDDLSVAAGDTPLTMRIELGEVQVTLTDAEVNIDDTLYFGLGSAKLEGTARTSLEAVARTLRSNPGLRTIRIEGHADRSGSDDRNQELSEQRSRIVLETLVMMGVDSYRLESVGYGSSRPTQVAGADGAARNRRVVFRVLEETDAVELSDDNAP